MMRVVLLLAALVFAPAATAAIVAEATTTHVELHDGDLQGTLAILRARYTESATPDAAFHVTAPYLYLEIDHTEAATGRPVAVFAPSTTNQSEHHHARLIGTGNGFDGAFYVLPFGGSPAPSVTVVEASCIATKRSSSDVERTEAHIKPRPARDQPTRGALHIEPCQDEQELVIEGDFTLQLWEWTASLTSDEGAREIRTGIHGQGGVEVGSADEVFIVARDARLTISAFSADYTLLLNNADSTARSIHASAAHGILHTADAVTFTGDDLEFHGTLATTLHGNPSEDTINLAAFGTLAGASIAGTPVPMITGAATPTTSPSLSLPLALAFVAGVAIAARRTTQGLWIRARAYKDPLFVDFETPSRRERRIQGLHIQATNCKRKGQERRFLRLRRRARRLAGEDSHAWLLEGEALLQAQDPVGARIAYENALCASPSVAHSARAHMGLAAVGELEQDYERSEHHAVAACEEHSAVFQRLLSGNLGLLGRLQEIADTLLPPPPSSPAGRGQESQGQPKPAR